MERREKGRVNKPASPPATVSLLKTNACTFRSVAVGPYTSWMGTTSYVSRPGLKSWLKASTRSRRVERGSSWAAWDFLVSKAASGGLSFIGDLGSASLWARRMGMGEEEGAVPDTPTIIFRLARNKAVESRILWPG